MGGVRLFRWRLCLGCGGKYKTAEKVISHEAYQFEATKIRAVLKRKES